MSTASDYLQVWQQVKEWPVSLRRDLAEEIIRSVESELPEATGEWSDAKNDRRIDLIDKDVLGTIQPAERSELELLTLEMRAHRRRVMPIPMNGAQKLLQQLLEKQRHHDGLPE